VGRKTYVWNSEKYALFAKMWEAGDPIDKIAQACGVTRASAIAYRHSAGLPSRDALTKISFVQMLENGMSLEAIAKKMKTSRSALTDKAIKLGIYKKNGERKVAPPSVSKLTPEQLRRKDAGAEPLRAFHPIAMETLEAAERMRFDD